MRRHWAAQDDWCLNEVTMKAILSEAGGSYLVADLLRVLS